jgi:putative spermidine/putrescine transport system ATP-binding protein
MIAGFERPTAGRVLLGGRDVTRVAPFDRPVNTVFQDYALFPHMTVEQNVGYGLMVRRTPKSQRRERVASVLHSVQLDGYAARKPSELSGGRSVRWTASCVSTCSSSSRRFSVRSGSPSFSSRTIRMRR